MFAWQGQRGSRGRSHGRAEGKGCGPEVVVRQRALGPWVWGPEGPGHEPAHKGPSQAQATHPPNPPTPVGDVARVLHQRSDHAPQREQGLVDGARLARAAVLGARAAGGGGGGWGGWLGLGGWEGDGGGMGQGGGGWGGWGGQTAVGMRARLWLASRYRPLPVPGPPLEGTPFLGLPVISAKAHACTHAHVHAHNVHTCACAQRAHTRTRTACTPQGRAAPPPPGAHREMFSLPARSTRLSLPTLTTSSPAAVVSCTGAQGGGRGACVGQGREGRRARQPASRLLRAPRSPGALPPPKPTLLLSMRSVVPGGTGHLGPPQLLWHTPPAQPRPSCSTPALYTGPAVCGPAWRLADAGRGQAGRQGCAAVSTKACAQPPRPRPPPSCGW